MDQLQVVTEITKEIKQKMIFVAMEGSELTGKKRKKFIIKQLRSRKRSNMQRRKKNRKRLQG
ncbi:hypothetical protein ACT7DA_20975 [Bacillus pacificus]